jgi:ribonuclease HI
VTNNQAKSYALLRGMSIAIGLGIKELVIIGDSRIIIKSLVFKEPPKDLQLASIIAKATKLTQKLNKHTLYHVL